MEKYSFSRLKLSLAVLLVGIAFITACSNSDYTSQYFSYPPTSKPHEQGWLYIGEVVVYGSVDGSVCKRSPKKVHIFIEDKQGRKLLSDHFQFEKGCIRSAIKWDTFENITIILSEKGNPYVKGDYNKSLLRVGTQKFKKLTYHFNQDVNKFVQQVTD